MNGIVIIVVESNIVGHTVYQFTEVETSVTQKRVKIDATNEQPIVLLNNFNQPQSTYPSIKLSHPPLKEESHNQTTSQHITQNNE